MWRFNNKGKLHYNFDGRIVELNEISLAVFERKIEGVYSFEIAEGRARQTCHQLD